MKSLALFLVAIVNLAAQAETIVVPAQELANSEEITVRLHTETGVVEFLSANGEFVKGIEVSLEEGQLQNAFVEDYGYGYGYGYRQPYYGYRRPYYPRPYYGRPAYPVVRPYPYYVAPQRRLYYDDYPADSVEEYRREEYIIRRYRAY